MTTPDLAKFSADVQDFIAKNLTPDLTKAASLGLASAAQTANGGIKLSITKVGSHQIGPLNTAVPGGRCGKSKFIPTPQHWPVRR